MEMDTAKKTKKNKTKQSYFELFLNFLQDCIITLKRVWRNRSIKLRSLVGKSKVCIRGNKDSVSAVNDSLKLFGTTYKL